MDGPETGGDLGYGKGTTGGTGGCYDQGACPEERGDLEVPGIASHRYGPGPGVGRSSGKGRQQGAPLRPSDGVADPSSAQYTLQILVKYSRSMKDLLKEIQKLLPPSSTPRRMLYPGPPGSPTGTLYEVIGEVELVPAS